MSTCYHLIFRDNNLGDYDVFEQHICQYKGCLWTSPEFTGRTCLPGKVDEFVEEYHQMIKEQDGKVVSYEVKGHLGVEWDD
jgi:hypothetical protein